MTDEEKTIIEEDASVEEDEVDVEKADTALETQPIDIPPTSPAVKAATKKQPMILYVIIILLIAAMAVMGYFLFLKKEPTIESSGQIRQMQQLAEKVQGMEAEKQTKENEIFTLMDEYKEKTGQEIIGINPLDLSDEQKELLEQRIRDEQDVSHKALLEEILEKNKEIRELNEKIAEIEKLLPKPHVVLAGENHYQVAMDFLMNEKKVEQKRAMELVERAALFDTLVPGFKVWNFYTGDEYGTSVTQGTADISPNTLIRRAKKQLVDARDEAIAQRDNLAGEIKVLEEKRDEIIKQVDTLTIEKTSLIGKVGELNEQVNSLFFLVGSQRTLREKGILKGGFLKSTKLKDVSPENFTRSMDLRTENQIVISAEEHGLRKIKKVNIYPVFYKEGTDYKVEIAPDKKSAALTILDTNKFKNERMVISLK
jgi:hypothetical protein